MVALPSWLPPSRLVLDNGRMVHTIDPSDAAVSTLEYQGARYVDDQQGREERAGELVLITTDSVHVRNPFFEREFPGLRTAIPLRVIFDERAPADRIVLDSTTLFAIGLPQGEPVAVGACRGRANRIRNVLFGHRHAIARVGRTAVIDIEKPVTRLPGEMLDLLGVNAGDRVIIEGAAHRRDDTEVTRVSLRALPWRERSPLPTARTTTGVPDNQQLVGDEDFPWISLDRAARRRSGVVPGAAVYVWPAVSSLLGREFTTVWLS